MISKGLILRAELRAWGIIARLWFCGAAALIHGLAVGIQGNGNLIPSGIFLGAIMGSAWSAALLFGVPRLARNCRLPLQVVIWSASFCLAVVLFFRVLHLFQQGYPPGR